MKFRLLSTSDAYGGAARAAYRLHSAFQRATLSDVQTVLHVARRHTDDCSIHAPRSTLEKGWPYLKTAIGAASRDCNPLKIQFSIPLLGFLAI